MRELGEEPGTHPCEAYLAYIELLSQWNRTYSLTGIRGEARMLTHHIFDSLSALPYVRGTPCLDVGSGAGLPGFILALARPEQEWVLLDSNKKKIRFLRQAVLELKPGNVEVVHNRLEDYRPGERFMTVISRALTSLEGFRNLSLPVLRADGRIVAMKGTCPEAELKVMRGAGLAYAVHELTVPGTEAERHIIVMEGHPPP